MGSGGKVGGTNRGIDVPPIVSSSSCGLSRTNEHTQIKQTLNNHYPERVHRILVVNAPRYVCAHSDAERQAAVQYKRVAPSSFLPHPKTPTHVLPSPPFTLLLLCVLRSFFGPAFKILSTVMPAAIRDQLQVRFPPLRLPSYTHPVSQSASSSPSSCSHGTPGPRTLSEDLAAHRHTA